VSAPHEVLVLRLLSHRPRGLSFDMTLDRPERATVAATAQGSLEAIARVTDN